MPLSLKLVRHISVVAPWRLSVLVNSAIALDLSIQTANEALQGFRCLRALARELFLFGYVHGSQAARQMDVVLNFVQRTSRLMQEASKINHSLSATMFSDVSSNGHAGTSHL